MASLLGDDGRGYELARKLESHGVWRMWLGDPLYSAFIHFLSTPSSWEAFMRADDNKTKGQLQLQLRARALLFDKASPSFFLRSTTPSSSSSSSSVTSPNSVQRLNPNYLQLHGDDVYFTLDNSSGDGVTSSASSAALSKLQSKSAYGAGPRFGELEAEAAMAQRFKFDEFPETWYAQFFEKYKASKSYRVTFGDQETEKRTPEQMSIYLRVLEKHKRRRVAFREEHHACFGNSGDESNTSEDETLFFPETMFTMNCIPDRAVLRTTYGSDNPKVKFNGVLDTLPQVMAKSPVINPIMIERLGIRPEYLNMEQGGRGMNGPGGSKKLLSEEQASQMSQKVIARMLSNIGFEASSGVPSDVLAQLLSCHVTKLGRILRLLADSYRKQCSAHELIKMFLHTAGHSNLGALAELVKDNTRSSVHQAQQHLQGIQSQLQLQQQASMRQSQQIARQMHPQMQQMLNPQNLVFQQQQQIERMRRRQQSTPRPVMSMNTNSNMNMSMNMNTNMNMNINSNVNMSTDQQRPMVQVKIENASEFPIDSNAYNAMSARQAQVQQFRQQQYATMSPLQAQPGNQFRPVGSPQMHSPNSGMVRAPPVKVEGFQELMGGDGMLKHGSEENKLTSPSN